MKITAHAIDDWECTCHNRPHLDGFYPCDKQGKEVDPADSKWDQTLYVCGQCGNIIDQFTLEIKGKTVSRQLNEILDLLTCA